MATQQEAIVISAPEFETINIKIVGTAPYVQLRFGEKAKATMREKQSLGQQARKGKSREARNFDDDYLNAMYQSEEGWYGIPASSFRKGAISACRLVGFKMTLAKLSIFVEADGLDALDGTPLIKITGEPEPTEHAVRNATGVADLRIRAMWRQWEALLTVRFDSQQFAAADVVNLIHRVGQQVGIGEGRPDSKNSAGMDWGLFRVV